MEVFHRGSDSSSGGSKSEEEVWEDPVGKFNSVKLGLKAGGRMEV